MITYTNEEYAHILQYIQKLIVKHLKYDRIQKFFRGKYTHSSNLFAHVSRISRIQALNRIRARQRNRSEYKLWSTGGKDNFHFKLVQA